jgi:rhomboid family GlyGly-CTERM serine protease
MTRGARAWLAVAALLGGVALAGTALPPNAIDWQPLLAWREPWRAFSAVGVHYSAQHLFANLVGLAVAAAFGVVAQVPARAAWAWLAAWPLTQFGLLLRPDLAHFGGLSGVLHGGVAAVAVALLARGTTAQRVVGGAVLAGLCAKIASESPWGPTLRHPPGWDIAVAPLAHATGAVAGAACAGLALWLGRRPAQARR